MKMNGGYYGLFCNCANLFYQIKDIMNPLSDKHHTVVIIYTIFTTISLILYWLAYCKNKRNLILPAYLIAGVRNAVRMFDFEESRLYVS